MPASARTYMVKLLRTNQLALNPPSKVSLPNGSVLTPAQWDVLLVLADTVIAPLSPAEIAAVKLNTKSLAFKRLGDEKINYFLASKASDSPTFKDGMEQLFQRNIPPDALKYIGTGINILNHRITGFLIGSGRRRISDLTIEERESLFLSWSRSSAAPLRGLYKLLTTLLTVNYLISNPLAFEVMGFHPDVNVNDRKRYVTKQFPQYEFLDLSAADEFRTDVLIIGSGSGGGVVASTLAKAGRRVLVIEKGIHYPQNKLPYSDFDSQEAMYESFLSADKTVNAVAGSVFGGGSTVNWSASLHPASFVRQEWAARGLTNFLSPQFQQSLDFVCDRMGVSDKHIRHNHGNNVLMDGARKCGYTYKPVPQNTGGFEHYDGYCGGGCRFGEKQGGVMTWLADAKDQGAQFLTHTHVRKLIIRNGKAMGAEVLIGGSKTLNIYADTVVLSAGSLNSPSVLQRSGIKNPNIGKNLKLHPVTFVFGYWDDRETKPFEGGILTSVVTSRSNRDQQGHGCVLEAVTMQPLANTVMKGWEGRLAIKQSLLRYNQQAGFISLARDKGSGRMTIDKYGNPIMHYSLSKFDAESILIGVVDLCKILLAENVDEIVVTLGNVPSFKPDKTNKLGANDPKFLDWIKLIKKVGVIPGRAALNSAHQMGSNRMSTSQINGVVDPNGRSWDLKNLYVADASVMPSASGVNPMITTMAISHQIALSILKDLSKNEGSARL